MGTMVTAQSDEINVVKFSTAALCFRFEVVIAVLSLIPAVNVLFRTVNVLLAAFG